MSIFKSLNKAFNSAFNSSMGKTVRALRRPLDTSITGFEKSEFDRFMQQASSVASQNSFLDPESQTPTFKPVKKSNAATQNGQFVNQDQMKDMMKAFRQRQQEVFGRRAAPGVAQQTRFM